MAGIVILGGALGVLRPPASVAAQDDGEIWVAPVNLSASGSASQPVITVGTGDTLHALWWDPFEGTKYSSFTPEVGWSAPTTVPSVIGGRDRDGILLAPRNVHLMADAARFTHVFWLDIAGNLMYARKQVGFSEWSGATQIATEPLSWAASIDSVNRLHVAFVRTSPVGGFAPGVYYRQSNTNGAGWSGAVQVAESLYFRTLAEAAAHVNVVSDGLADTLVTWDDPQLGQSLYARLSANGLAFSEALPIEAGASAGDAPPKNTLLSALPDGSFLALWQAGEGCSLYEQVYSPSAATWTLSRRVLDALESCPRQLRSYQTSDGKLLVVMEQLNGGVTMATWDSSGWSEPFSSQIRFVHPLTDRPTILGCLKIALQTDHIAAIGCDDNGDVWVITSQLVISDLLPALESVWTNPIILAEPPGQTGMPAVAMDSSGVLHTLWSESAPSGGDGMALRYARGEGSAWSSGSLVLRSPTGKAEQPALSVDAGGLLHAVWSGGDSGRIYYSQAFVRDAPAPTGWSPPVALPAPRNVGASPSLVGEVNGKLHLVYAIPLNEERGVYYLRSDDQGQTWTEPIKIFDAIAAQWAMVADTRLAREANGRLHVIWTRLTLSAAGNALGAYHSYSDDDGLTWSEPIQIAAGAISHSQITTAAPGELHLVWVLHTLGKIEVWHRWSVDGGNAWSEPQRVLDTTSGLVEQVNLVSDEVGHVFMTGIDRTVQSGAELFSLEWNGQGWDNRERVSLGYDATDEAGSIPVLLPGQLMGALYRIRSPLSGGGAFYSIGYTERPVEIVAPPVVATFTPPPAPTDTPAPTLALTAEPSPTPNLDDAPPALPGDQFWLRVWGVGAVMLLISVVAIARLWGGRRR